VSLIRNQFGSVNNPSHTITFSQQISLLQATICTAVKNSLNNKSINSTNIKYITQTTFISVYAKQNMLVVDKSG